MTTMTDPTLLEVTRVFDAPPSRVFDAWMVREEWEQWVGPEGTQSEVPLLEPRVGGGYKVIMHMTDGRVIPVVGVFKEIERPTRIAFTWKWEGDAAETLVVITLRDVNGGTELTLRHEGLLTTENRDRHGMGWNSAFNKLGNYLTA